MVTQRRWQRAQEYEEGFWQGVARNTAEGLYEEVDFYEWRAGQLAERLRSVGAEQLLNGGGRLLEIGSGPIGVLGFLPGSVKVAVDPLNEFYGSQKQFADLRPLEVEYLSASGETIPIAHGAFDLVIIENTIDHVHDVHAVMSEVHRLLTDNGLLYITVNGRCRLGYWVHRALSRAGLDPGHPHTFTHRGFRKLVESYDFRILQLDAGSWREEWIRDLSSSSTRARLKGLLLVSEHLLTILARKSRLEE